MQQMDHVVAFYHTKLFSPVFASQLAYSRHVRQWFVYKYWLTMWLAD